MHMAAAFLVAWKRFVLPMKSLEDRELEELWRNNGGIIDSLAWEIVECELKGRGERWTYLTEVRYLKLGPVVHGYYPGVNP